MKANMMKWINQVYQLISHSTYFWLGIFTKGVVQTLANFYTNDGVISKFSKTRYQRALSIMWLLLLINLFLASNYYMEINNPLLNFLSYLDLLVFIVITVYISWLSFIRVTMDVTSETEGLLIAFHSAVRYWSSSLSFSLYLIIALLVGYSNLIVLLFILPGLYFQLSKLLMERHLHSIEETQLLLKH